jgi:hypothetical protein
MPVDRVIRINQVTEIDHSTQGDAANADRSGKLVLRFKAGAMPRSGPGNPSKSSCHRSSRADGSSLQPSCGTTGFWSKLTISPFSPDETANKSTRPARCGIRTRCALSSPRRGRPRRTPPLIRSSKSERQQHRTSTRQDRTTYWSGLELDANDGGSDSKGSSSFGCLAGRIQPGGICAGPECPSGNHPETGSGTTRGSPQRPVRFHPTVAR